MSPSAAEVEELLERLGRAGVTLLIQIDEPRVAAGDAPWIAMASGPGAPTGGFQVRGCETLEDCLVKVSADLPQDDRHA
ncbi:hypothetical protein GCM10029976_007070 [Kribbella albertanoniae]